MDKCYWIEKAGPLNGLIYSGIFNENKDDSQERALPFLFLKPILAIQNYLLKFFIMEKFLIILGS